MYGNFRIRFVNASGGEVSYVAASDFVLGDFLTAAGNNTGVLSAAFDLPFSPGTYYFTGELRIGFSGQTLNVTRLSLSVIGVMR